MVATAQQHHSGTDVDRDEALRTIRDLLPLRHLSDREFANITNGVRVENCTPGNDFFRSGRDDQFIFYLLSGEVSITDAEGNTHNVTGGSIDARSPLAPHPRERVKATARTPTRFVRFPGDLMRLANEATHESITVDEITQGDEAPDKRALFEVYHALMNDDLVLPSLPDVAIRIREAANSEDMSVEDVARIIQTDASTTAYCISVANSAAYTGNSQVDKVLDAVVRMGIEPTRDVVVAYTMRSLFTSKDPTSKKLMHDAWKHSCRIAALSFILARDVARLNPERALLAGLLHDIGVTVLISEAQKYSGLMDDIITFNRLCHELSGQIGAMILRAWKFPDVFMTSALEAESFDHPAAERLQLCDVVMLAHLHDEKPAPWSLPTADLSELPIHELLDAHDMTEDCRLAVIEQAEHELTELTQVLSG